MIDYAKLSHAILVAESLGYKRVEVDWIVSPDICDVTRPDHAHPITVSSKEDMFNGELIASGEIGLLLNAPLYSGDNLKLVTCTPCFRSEPQYIPGLYEPWFMKVELMIANPTEDLKAATALMTDAKTIMGTWTRKLEFDPGTGDLNLNGIEVGSYGIRRYKDFRWAYGTAIAEPRFTYALNGGKI